MTYIQNCEKHRDTIKNNFSSAQCVEEFLSPEEIAQLSLLQFQLADRLKWTRTSNNIQPVCNIDEIFNKMPILDKKFTELLGDYHKNHTGNYYITTQLHDLHVDLLTEEECNNEQYSWTKNVIPYKSVVIPLMISENANAYTVFYKQRHIGYSITLDKAGVSEQKDSMYHLSRDYPIFETVDIQGEYDVKPLTPHIPKENLEGLEVENVFEFMVGDVMVFDSCQIHASCVTRSNPNYKWLKSGMNIQFYKEI